MKEEEIHAIWAGLKFERLGLKTTQKQAVKILQLGHYNLNQGPDFLDARLLIDHLQHEGHVELHLDGDDWYRHQHHLDPNYNAVILHVVLHKSKVPPRRQDGTLIPELVLGKILRNPKGHGKMNQKLACASLGERRLAGLDPDWVEAMGRERLQQKLNGLSNRLEYLKWDWQQLIWEELCRSFGGPVNGLSFWEMSQVASWRIVRKYQFKLDALKALLLGVSGLLEGRPLDEGQAQLKMEWEFLREKHQIQPLYALLKKHRMRPASMPVVRIGMLAAVARAHVPLVQFLEPSTHASWLNIQIESQRGRKLGHDQKFNALANVFWPISQLYQEKEGKHSSSQFWESQLKALPPEDNKKIRLFVPLGFEASNRLQSQGLIHIYQHYCQQLRCLQCPYGSQVLGREMLAMEPCLLPKWQCA